jgi:hypothetical protein
MKSKHDKVEPSLVTPYTDSEEPRRHILLKDNEAPNWIKSKSDIDEPSLHMPYIESAEPNRA